MFSLDLLYKKYRMCFHSPVMWEGTVILAIMNAIITVNVEHTTGGTEKGLVILYTRKYLEAIYPKCL